MQPAEEARAVYIALQEALASVLTEKPSDPSIGPEFDTDTTDTLRKSGRVLRQVLVEVLRACIDRKEKSRNLASAEIRFRRPETE